LAALQRKNGAVLKKKANTERDSTCEREHEHNQLATLSSIPATSTQPNPTHTTSSGGRSPLALSALEIDEGLWFILPREVRLII
jgi:hypothetical protein